MLVLILPSVAYAGLAGLPEVYGSVCFFCAGFCRAAMGPVSSVGHRPDFMYINIPAFGSFKSYRIIAFDLYCFSVFVPLYLLIIFRCLNSGCLMTWC